MDDGALIFEVEFENAIHAGEDEHESTGAGECAPGEAGARASTEDGNVVSGGEADDFGDFGAGGREGDEVGAAFFNGAVVFVEDEVFGTGEDGVLAEKFFERADEVAGRWRFGGFRHGGFRLAQMAGCGEMTQTYIEEEL